MRRFTQMDPSGAFGGILLLVAIGATACLGFGPNAEAVLSKYLDASFHARYEEAYQYISEKDRAVKTLQDYTGDQAKADPFAQALADKISFKIKETKVQDNKAVVKVDVETPNLSEILGELLGAAFQSAFSDKKDQRETERRLAEKLRAKRFPTMTVSQTFWLVKEAGGWKVFLGWEAAKAMKEAEQLEREKKLTAAKEKYQRVLELDSRVVEAEEKIRAIDTKIKDFEEKQAYIDKVVIENLQVAPSLLGPLGVFGEVKNLGNRTLRKVEITIYFLDKNGGPVFEKTYHPVLVSEYSLFTDDNTPLKPGYSRKFGVRTDDVPSDWAKRVRVKVTDIEFQR